MSAPGISLSQHLSDESQRFPDQGETLTPILSRIGVVGELLSKEIARAALTGRLGLAGESNATGDDQKKLDVFANDKVVEAFQGSGLLSWIVSEELEDALRMGGESEPGYVLGIDPLDGSSNVDVNGDLGLIFGVYPQGIDHENVPELLPGSKQISAGYVLFGPSTMFVYTAGHGVHGFTLDQESGEFLLTHENIQCPEEGKVYSANLANERIWASGIQKFVAAKAAATAPRSSLRYSGALVADFHRCLMEGGIYFYPADSRNAQGKLRLFYECAPMALIAHHAGGRATTGATDILDIQAETLHQRIPFIIGSAKVVTEYEKFFQQG